MRHVLAMSNNPHYIEEIWIVQEASRVGDVLHYVFSTVIILILSRKTLTLPSILCEEIAKWTLGVTLHDSDLN